ncbi:MAG: pilus assembly protein PilM [Candidatus Omnitrophica bacterium]|nr:pilus assembly protein PilM [Candidatus Omnitrophota bacterium]
MKTLGIYFGPKLIHLVEADGTKLLNTVQIPLQRLTGAGIEEKVPDEIKIAAALKDELRKGNIESKDANIVLLGRDLIIRTFHMPVLPANELFNAVRFEAKKYIPFKVDELVYDYQLSLDRVNRKYLVLFIGVKKDNLEKYQAIFTQLGAKINSIEYAGFSMVRLYQAAKVKERGVAALVNVDLAEDDEVNFIVMENNFPLFSRDIILAGEVAVEGSGLVKPDLAQNLEKLKVELRISLDFYLRKFPTKNISAITFIAPDEYRAELEAFIKDRGIAARFFDAKKMIDRPVGFSLSLLKAYAAAVAKTVKSDIKVDLLPSKIKAKMQDQSSIAAPAMFSSSLVLRNLVIAGLIVAIPFGYYFYRIQPVKAQIRAIKAQRVSIAAASGDQSYDELIAVNKAYVDKYRMFVDLVNKRTFVTGDLDAIPRVIPDGVWLRELQFSGGEGKVLMTMIGSAYLGNTDEERNAVNRFAASLKENGQLTRHFRPEDISLVSVEEGKIGKVNVINFNIECRSK